jgi:hypothetical protein
LSVSPHSLSTSSTVTIWAADADAKARQICTAFIDKLHCLHFERAGQISQMNKAAYKYKIKLTQTCITHVYLLPANKMNRRFFLFAF